MKDRVHLLLLPLGIIAVLALFLLVERRPVMFANATYLGAILAVQVAVFGLSHFEEIFFPLLMGTFLWAGSWLPYYGIAMSLRWLFLGVGALAGFFIWIRSPRAQHFRVFHLVALFCVVSALASALVSEVPKTAALKVVSLFLLFLYASAGARVAISGREHKFLPRLVLVCEALVYVSAVCYFGFGYPIFGNPNALGAIISVAIVPVLLWAAVIADTRGLRQRRFFALALCGGLLYVSNSRASILSAAIVVVALTVALRAQRLLMQCAFVSVFFLTVMAVINPSHMSEMAASFTGRVIYKEAGVHSGVFGSRMSPWTDTYEVVKSHPWFGSGFGTSELGELRRDIGSSFVHTLEGTNREHGNSYLALAEYMGIFGGIPFIVLLFLLIRVVGQAYSWTRRTGDPYHPCIPFALIALAGLIHACFEDWLFAVGSYLCVFLWVSAFILMDLVPERESERSRITSQRRTGGVASTAAVAHSLR
jgi:O-antigen ligase